MTVRNKVVDGVKKCAGCSELKPISEFHPKGYLCKPCHRASCKIRHQKERFKKYGITRADFERMLHQQGNRCAICLCIDPEKTGWRVDHNHEFDFVRGVLCHRCNTLLGHAKEKVETLSRAIDYLQRQFRS